MVPPEASARDAAAATLYLGGIFANVSAAVRVNAL